MSTHINPADKPSRYWEPDKSGGKKLPSGPAQAPVSPLADSALLDFDDGTRYFFMLCSGMVDAASITAMLINDLNDAGLPVRVVPVDPRVDAAADLRLPGFRKLIDYCIDKHRCVGCFASPPCSTWSKARHRPLGQIRGPRPLRSRDTPFSPLPALDKRELKAFHAGTFVMLATLHYLIKILEQGWWGGLEHPDDSGGVVLSIWNTNVLHCISEQLCMCQLCLHQCRYEGVHVKPTRLLLPPWRLKGLSLKCNYRHRHPPCIGLCPSKGA